MILDRGNLGVAMRASMAVPGAFTPVELDGRTLVDGGIVKNVPVDVVKNMGADILIVVDVGLAGAQALGKKKLESMGQILGQTYELFRLEQRAALTNATVLLAPDTSAYSAGDFQLGADLIKTGETEGKKYEAELQKFGVPAAEYRVFLEKQRRRRSDTVVVKSIDITGDHDVDQRVIKARIKSNVGAPLDPAQVNEDIAHIHGMGDFQTVTYRLKLEDDGARLEYLTQEKPWGPTYIHMGLRLQTDFDDDSTWAMLLNIDRKCLNELGGELSIDAEIGTRRRIALEVYQPLSYAGLFFVSPHVELERDQQGIYDGHNKIATYDTTSREAGLDLGMQMGRYGEIMVGAVGGEKSADLREGSENFPDADDTIAASTASIAMDRRDQAVFARTGYLFRMDGQHATGDLGSDVDYDKGSVRALLYHSLGDHTFTLGGDAGSSFGTDIPVYDQFRVGGFGSIVGLSTDQYRGNYAASVHLAYRYRFTRLSPSIGNGVYLVGLVDAGNAWAESDDMSTEDLITGAGAGIGADTVLGPFVAGLGHAEGGQSQIFMSLGTIF